jgi:hypothetical protein
MDQNEDSEVLYFSGIYTTTSEAIVEKLGKAKDVTSTNRKKTIEFHGVNFDDDVVSATVDLFRDVSEKDCLIRKLQLKCCRGRVGEVLKEAKAFAEISIDWLDDDEGEPLLPVLPAICMGMRCNPNLKKVELGEMSVSVREARVLGQGLKTAGSHFKELSLELVYIDQDERNAVSELAAGFRYNSSLEQISLVQWDLRDVEVGWVADALVGHPSLKALSLSDSIDFGPQGLAALARLLNNSSLESLSLCSHGPGLGTHIKILAEALKGNQNLKKLDLAYNQIGDEGLNMLTSTVCTYPTRLEELNLADNRISDQGLGAFASRPISSCLRRLDLHCDHIFSADENRYLLEALQLNPQLGKIENDWDDRLDPFPPDVRHLLDLNWCGRVLLGQDTSVPLSIWPVVLGRANTAFRQESNQEERRANAIFHLLQGPALMQRSFDSVGVSVGEKRTAGNTVITTRDRYIEKERKARRYLCCHDC